jgi:peptidylprolyl isomerase
LSKQHTTPAGQQGRRAKGSRVTQREKPEIDFPEGEPPSDLVIVDEIVGDGPEAQVGHTVVAHYVGVAFSTGEEFDSSWSRGDPLAFPLGKGRVIKGWDQGLVGMRVGGRRKLVIPSDLAYGKQGAGGAIAPGETLIFVVDLVDVT